MGDMLARMRDKIDEPIAAILTLNTIGHTVGAAMGGAIALQVFGNRWVALFSALLTMAILIRSVRISVRRSSTILLPGTNRGGRMTDLMSGSKIVEDLLTEMRSERIKMAIVHGHAAANEHFTVWRLFEW